MLNSFSFPDPFTLQEDLLCRNAILVQNCSVLGGTGMVDRQLPENLRDVSGEQQIGWQKP